jgi:hypothetical protein
MAPALGRLFRLRIRPGRAVLGFGSGKNAAAGLESSGDEEIVVPEEVAAFLVKHRTAEVIEVIERPLNDESREPQPGGD